MKSVYKILPVVDYQQWSQYFSSVNIPNLVQSWSYGDAKMKIQDYKLMRGIIYENEHPIALIQVWYKKYLFLKVVRLSYGPLWIIEKPNIEQIHGVFRVIKKYWNLRNLSVLSVAPNIVNLPEYNNILTKLRYYKRKSKPYDSGIINLNQSISDLRAKLRQNWRNQLTTSEKKGLTFHVSQDYSDFLWMMSCFEMYREQKNFYGHSIPLLDALHKNSFDFHQTWVAIATCNGERVAGMLIAYYGLSCTPLVIWLNKNGRALNAGNFLFWNSILYAKNMGSAWFDLGGTNDATKFKTGLPHEKYQMIGEYYSLI